MKTLRTLLAERLDGLELAVELDGFDAARAEVVDTAVHAVHAWLTQPDILLIMTRGMADKGTVGGAALALRREATL